MLIRKFLSAAKNNYVNKRGFHTQKKIVVIESDDWGSIRMPSENTYNKLISLGDPVDRDAFLSNDSLESYADVSNLYSVLSEFRGADGNSPCITANFAVANPDFDAIDINKNIFSFEPFTSTYERYYGSENGLIELFKKGHDMHLFVPQLHAREHMNVARWMRDLRRGKKDTVLAYENKTIGTGLSFSRENAFGYMDALNYDSLNERKQLEKYLTDAADIFNETFGYSSRTFVASCFIWTGSIEKYLSKIGIELIQTQFRQQVCPFRGTSVILKPYHYTGQMNSLGQIYSLRNCEYEPAYDHNVDLRVDRCLCQIRQSFENLKPAVINSHRFNYISRINKTNASYSLNGLRELLRQIIKEYPDVVFMSSVELLDEIKQNDDRF